jgi:DNA-binding GntR family transcriptional regulator
MALKPRQNTVKENIYRRLRTDILNGRKRPGERLAVDELTAGFGTSVTPVRDALQMLSQEGLVTIRPRAGYFVSRITLKELSDMLELREILESAAVERAARKISRERLEELHGVHAGYSGDDEESYTRYTDENRRFHFLIAEASENQELATLLGHLHDRLARFMVIRHAGRDLKEIHSLLLERLEAHDPAGARKAILDEMKDTRAAIMERVLQEEAAFWHLGGSGEPGRER